MMAKELGHGAASNSTEEYGKMGLGEVRISEFISRDPKVSTWHSYAELIFPKIEEQLLTKFDMSPPLFGGEDYYYKRHIDGLIIEVVQINSEIISVNFDHDCDFRPYLQQLKSSFKKAAQSETDLEVLNALGELSYLLYRIAPWVLGSSSMVDWICHGVAKSKEVVLGNRIEEPCSLDFMAFLASDQKHYADWFMLNAYERPAPVKQVVQEASEKMPIETHGYSPKDNPHSFFSAEEVVEKEKPGAPNNLKSSS